MTPNQFSSKVAAMGRVGTLLPGLMARTGQASLKFYLAQFDHQGSEPNERFVPWKARKYQVNHQLLNDTGKLRAGFNLQRKGTKGFTINNDVPYAQYHNEGTGTLPKRPLLYDSKQLEKQITADLTQALSRIFK